jgi:CheY-like chemotaxis protein
MAFQGFQGFQVTESKRDEVVELALRLLPDVILMDAMSQSWYNTGWELASKIRLTQLLASVIIVSAYTGFFALSKAIQCGAVYLLTKPFDPFTLPNLVRSAYIHNRLTRLHDPQ